MNFLTLSSIFLITTFSIGGSTYKSEAVTSFEPLTRTNRSRRLVGGKNTVVSLFPHHVSLEYENQIVCGGAIISVNHVLTAAHCRAEDLEKTFVRAGSERRKTGGSLHRVDKFVMPDNYTAIPSDGNDIAVIHVIEPFELDNYRQIITMFDAGEIMKPGAVADISSFGLGNNRLQQIAIPIIDWETCIKNYYYTSPGAFCAGFKNHNLCFGDSGAPVTVNLRLAGIVSYGFKGLDNNGQLCRRNPTVITEVAAFREWIRSVTHF